MQILSDSQFQYIHSQNEFDTSCFVTHVFILIVCDDTVKVLSTFKYLSQHSRMTWDT